MKTYPHLAVQLPDVYLPRPGIDLTKWAVIACDQFTSQPEYWCKVEEVVGSAPSTLNMIFPEVYLEQPGAEERIRHIQQSMTDYLAGDLLRPFSGLVYVERQVGGKLRRGLVLALDLEQYDYNKGSHSLIRATEGTIIERLPPRMRIREGAQLELPHILVLIDDPDRSVIEPVGKAKAQLKELYDFELMAGSGHLNGYLVNEPKIEGGVIAALERLADPGVFRKKYDLEGNQPVLLFAMGDGNHSLATAKAIWEKNKASVGMDHPSRFALVEIENVHDEGLEFAPIHRVIFGLKQDLLGDLQRCYQPGCSYIACDDQAEMMDKVNQATGRPQTIGVISPQGCGVLEISNPASNLPVGTLQIFLDEFMKKGGAEKIDYVHGEEVVCQLGALPGHTAFYLPGMDKSDLYKTVILDGALPRKTFSMGEAYEKRFYMECRKIA
ncbi:MAG: DUF1015 domain-containing protein [Anaerolineales bacterium]|nr:DUF1015 domain-containing protein [Anaerolineae bacterium]PWB56390.1 MAG: DUF1015 domain-containing protein [Anaerolineales bacterium]